MSLAKEGKDAVAQLAARFVFSDKEPKEQQAELAKCIEDAITEFKSADMQELIARTLREALRRRIEAAIDGWQASKAYPQPLPEPAPAKSPATTKAKQKAA